jgi:hypothetical protein
MLVKQWPPLKGGLLIFLLLPLIIQAQVKERQQKCKEVLSALSDQNITKASSYFLDSASAPLRKELARCAEEIAKIRTKAYPLGVPYFDDKSFEMKYTFYDFYEEDKEYFHIYFSFNKDKTSEWIEAIRFIPAKKNLGKGTSIPSNPPPKRHTAIEFPKNNLGYNGG